MDIKIGTLLSYGSFAIVNRNLLVIYGDLESKRELTPGMVINISLNSTTALSDEIHSIEVLRKEDREYTAVVLKYPNAEELDILEMLNIGNETCDIYLSHNKARKPFPPVTTIPKTLARFWNHFALR